MALAETAKLVVNLSLQGNFARDLRKTSGALGQFEARIDRTESRAFRAGQQIGTGIKRGLAVVGVGVGLIALNVERGLQSLVELEQQTAQTNAVIKSTGGIAGVTADEVGRLAEKYESLNATIGDEVIRSGENLLLTFTNIRKKGFERTLAAALDMNTALGKGEEGLTNTIKTLGVALNDPTKGLGRLSKAGVTFTAAQTKRIKQLQKEGKLYEAQAIILKEVEKRFGGSFVEQGGTAGAKVKKFHDAIEDLQRTLASGLLPVVSNVADALSKLLADPEVVAGVEKFGQELAKVLSAKNITAFISDVVGFGKAIAPAFKAAAGAVGFLVNAFNKLPPDLRNILVGAFVLEKATGGLVSNVIGSIGSALKTIIAGHVTVVGPVTGGGVGGGVAGAAKGGLGVLSKVFLVGEAIGLAALVFGIQQDLSAQATARAKEVAATQAAFLKTNPSTEAITNALAGVNEGIRQLQSNPLNVLVQGEALAELRAMQSQLHTALRTREGTQNPDRLERVDTARLQEIANVFVRANADRAGERGARGRAPGASTETQNNIRELANKLSPIGTNTGTVIPGSIERLRASSIASMNQLTTTTTVTGQAQKQATATGSQLVSSTTRSASLSNAAIVAGATRASASAIIGAIYAARPIINTTHVTRNTTIQQRYGPGNGSAGNNGPGASGV